MIVWIASYPRSGNSLVRSLLWQTLGLPSYADEEAQFLHAMPRIGGQERDEPWDVFYERVRASPEPVLVKTHLPPIDDQPFIYVIRDGRNALASYLAFHRTYHAEAGRTDLELVVGADRFGGWSRHVSTWCRRTDARGLIVRFEDLVGTEPGAIEAVQRFLGGADQAGHWSNPFADLKAEHPDFFRGGAAAWTPPEWWTDDIDRLFALLHGACMVEHGYWSAAEREARTAETPAAVAALAELCARQSERAESLQRHCEKRFEIMERLQNELHLQKSSPSKAHATWRRIGRLAKRR